MALSTSSETPPNFISGWVVLKESGVGIPNLLVVLFNGGQTAVGRASLPTGIPIDTGDRLGAVLTSRERGKEGYFELSYQDTEFKLNNSQEKRPDLEINVLAPEQPGLAPQVLYSALAARKEAGRIEQYYVQLSTEQLQKAGLAVPSEISADLEPSHNVAGRLTALAARQNDIVNGAVSAAQDVVAAHRDRVSGFHQTFKPTLLDALSRMPASPLSLDRFVTPADSVHDKFVAVAQKTIQETVNSDDVETRAPARGFISLTSDEVAQLRTQTAADGTVPATAVAALMLASAPVATARSTYVQAIDRVSLCRPATPNVDCTASILNPGPPSPSTPLITPGPSVAAISNDDVPRYLARLMEPMTAPEDALVLGLMPVATRDSVQNSIQSFSFNPSPADVPSFHDFNNIQIAFKYVWQEAIDQGALDLAQSAYQTIVELGGNPSHPDHNGLHPIRALAAEGHLVLNAHAVPNIVVRDHRGEPPGTRIAPPAETSAASGDSCAFGANATVRDHRTMLGNPALIADPTQRLPALLAALEKKMTQNYNFTTYAANHKERSVNFGILNTFRQTWTPLSYQAGSLMKTIPLAPKQSQKLVITRKTVKKRSQKELENNLRVLKQESSQTNRADQEIANRASLNTNFTTKNDATVTYEVASDTASTSFSLDSKKSSDDIKKSFREAVFKSAQEFKNEKTTEINTEESQEFDSVETTEISNPNDEIAVTFMFYELQRRYRLFERLYRVQPVVLVAQEFPQPDDIDQAWLVRYDWILRRAILDDSFLAALSSIAQTAGDEIALEEIQANVNQQRCLVNQLRQELAIATQQDAAQRALLNQAVLHKSGASDSGLFGEFGHLVGTIVNPVGAGISDVTGAIKKVENFILGDNADKNNSNQQAMQDRADEAANRIRDLTFRLEREVTALNALTETYAKALREHNNHLTEIARLKVHVRDNIMYYMQAIWMHEPADQRFFRLHDTPVPNLVHSARGYLVDFDNALAISNAAPHLALARFGGRDAKLFNVESRTKFNTQLTFKPLSQVADLDRLLGFKGNYAIFPLYESNALTDFMMDPYVDRATGQLVDPSDPLNWSLDEFSEYVCCLKKQVTDAELQTLLPQLQGIYKTILANPTRNNDVLVVPSNSLFIEALPAEHTLLERFKLDHRMIDVKKVQAEAREKELDNVRRAAKILAGERGDPHVDKKILIEGGANFVVPTGDQ
jgi:hypothetical protein